MYSHHIVTALSQHSNWIGNWQCRTYWQLVIKTMKLKGIIKMIQNVYNLTMGCTAAAVSQLKHLRWLIPKINFPISHTTERAFSQKQQTYQTTDVHKHIFIWSWLTDRLIPEFCPCLIRLGSLTWTLTSLSCYPYINKPPKYPRARTCPRNWLPPLYYC